MGNFANTVFSMMLGWFRTAVSDLWNLFTASDGNSLLVWIGNHWIHLVIILCVAGTAADIVVHLFRWRPLTVWASFFRRLRHHDQGEEETETPPRRQQQWIYADGSTASAPDQDWQEDAPEDEDFAEPYDQPVPTVANMSHTQYRRNTYANQVPPGMEDYPHPAPMQEEDLPPEPINRELAAPVQNNESRSRRVLRRVAEIPKSIWQSEDDDELQLRYQPAKPAVDKEDAYHAPVYPPTWKKPTQQS